MRRVKIARKYRFHGRVQGVFFRAQTRTAARTLGLTGWVRNLADGSVEAYAEGGAATLDELERRAVSSFDNAMVSRHEVEDAAVEGLSSFEIRY